MAIYGITIENLGTSASINDPVWLVGGKLTYGWKNINKVDPIPGKKDIVEVRQGGWENPILTIEGNIDINNTAGTYTVNGVAGCIRITQAALVSMSSLVQTSEDYLLMKVAYGPKTGSGVYLQGRGTGSGNYIDNLTGSFFTYIDQHSIDIPSDSVDNHMWNYNITIGETKKIGST